MRSYEIKPVAKYKFTQKKQAYLKSTAAFFTAIALTNSNTVMAGISGLNSCPNSTRTIIYSFVAFFLLLFLFFKLSLRLQKDYEGAGPAVAINISCALLFVLAMQYTDAAMARTALNKQFKSCLAKSTYQ